MTLFHTTLRCNLPSILAHKQLVAGGSYVYCHSFRNLHYDNGKWAYGVLPTPIKNNPNDAVTIMFHVDPTQYEIVELDEETAIVGNVTLTDFVIVPFGELLKQYFKK